VEFGKSVALSANGNAALVGGPQAGDLYGLALVFARSDATWTQQGELLNRGAVEVLHEELGKNVALSADGDLALIGTEYDRAWVFTRSGSTWSQQVPALACGAEGCGGV